MSYQLKSNVTNSMLVAQGFRIVIDADIKAIKSLGDRHVFVNAHNEVLIWRVIDIKDLIELGYVEELK